MRIGLLLAFLLGASLVAYSFNMPAYTDPDLKEEWDERSSDMHGKSEWNTFVKDYIKNVNEIRTNKIYYMDFGLGVCSLSIYLLIFVSVKKIKSLNSWKELESPSKKLTYYFIGNILCLMLIPASFLYYILRSARGDYPWFADSIGIPICSGTFLIIILILFVNMYFKRHLGSDYHPVRIFVDSSNMSKGDKLKYFILITLLSIFIIKYFLTGDFIGLPILLVFLYFLLSIRAVDIVAQTPP